MERVSDIFYNQLLGLGSAKELANAAGISIQQAKEFIEHQSVYQQFKKLPRSRYFVPITGDKWTWEIDLMFFKGVPILVCVEITSRLLRTAVLKNKEAKTCAEAFAHILQDPEIEFEAIENDDGAEFKGEFEKLLKKNGIKHLTYPSTEGSNTAMAKVERVNLTLRTWLNKLPDAYIKLHSWIPELTDYYNHRVHTVTKKAPIDFVDKDWEAQSTKERNKGIAASQLIDFEYPIGARVRLAKHLNIFGKKSQAKWTKEISTITKREGYSFFVEGHAKPFRAWEMLPIQEPVGQRAVVEEEKHITIPTAHHPAVPLALDKGKRVARVRPEPKAVAPKLFKPAKVAVTYVVEAILNHRRVKGKLEVLTKYVGFETPSWQPLKNFGVDNPILQAYLAKHPRLKTN